MKFKINFKGQNTELCSDACLNSIQIVNVKNISSQGNEFIGDNYEIEFRIRYILLLKINNEEISINYYVKLKANSETDHYYDELNSKTIKLGSFIRKIENSLTDFVQYENFTSIILLIMYVESYNLAIVEESRLKIDKELFYLGLSENFNIEEAPNYTLYIISNSISFNSSRQMGRNLYLYESKLDDKFSIVILIGGFGLVQNESTDKQLLLFSGTFQECNTKFNDSAYLEGELFNKCYKYDDNFLNSDDFESEPFKNSDEDYFNAMTDGQLGFYSDFDGHIDDIDTWSRG